LRDESITILPWPARSSDLNPTEHIWDIIGRRVIERTPPFQRISSVRLSPYVHSAICHVQQEATFVGPMNFPQWGQIPLTTCLTPLQTDRIVCLC
jgi:hypothetical protein